MSPLARRLDTFLPERRLADPRIALEEQRRPAGGHGVEELAQHAELGAPADDLIRQCALTFRAAALPFVPSGT